MSLTTAQRLERFYSKYNPEKIETIPDILKVFAGKEDKLFAELTKRYGPEPSADEKFVSPPRVTAPTLNDGNDELRARLYRFYMHYNPGNVANIEKVIVQFGRQPENLFQTLVEKYGPEPSLDGSPSTAALPRSATSASLPPQSATTTVLPRSATARSVPPSSNSSSSGSYRERLLALLTAYMPAKVDQVDALLDKYKGNEESYLAAIVQKYGPLPAEPTAPAAAAGASTAAATTISSYEARIRRFYEAYLPTKVGQEAAMASKYKGREEEYLAALVSKYGPEPASDAGPPSLMNTSGPTSLRQETADPTPQPVPASEKPFEQRLTAYFRAYLPSKLGQESALAEKYRGREDAYMNALVEKYGPEPASEAPSSGASAAKQSTSVPPSRTASLAPQPDATVVPVSSPSLDRRQSVMLPPATVQSRIRRMVETYLPAKVAQIPSLLEKYKGHEQEYLDALVAKYGAEPQPQPSAVAPGELPFEQRLTCYFQAYLPQKLGQERALAEKYAGREAEYMAALVQKYGPEPVQNGAAERPPGSNEEEAAKRAETAAASSSPQGMAMRIARMVQHYMPAKVSQLDALLHKYQGREAEYLAALVDKYGAEPPESSVPSSATVVPAEPASPPVASLQPQAQPSKDGVGETSSKQPLPPSSTPNTEQLRQRLTRFYQKYQPERIANIDTVMEKFAGREAELFESLVKKYGPEPVEAAQPAAEVPRHAPLSSEQPQQPVAATAGGTRQAPPAENLLQSISDGALRERVWAVAEAQGIVCVSDPAVLRLLIALSEAVDGVKQDLMSRDTLSSSTVQEQEESVRRQRLNESAYAAHRPEGSPRSHADDALNEWKSRRSALRHAVSLQMVALEELETEARNQIVELDDDERCILVSRHNTEVKHVALRSQIERVVNGTEAALRRRTYDAWRLFARARRHQRRVTQTSGMGVYQRMQMTPLAQKYYDHVRQQEAKKEERARQLREAEAHARAERIRRQQALLTKSPSFVSQNRSQSASWSPSTENSPARRTTGMRHALRPRSPRTRSPRHSIAAVYVDPKTGSAPVGRASSGKPSLATMVALRGGPSPSSRVDFLDRHARLQLIQQQFDLLPPAQKARVFRKLKKWDMVPVLSEHVEDAMAAVNASRDTTSSMSSMSPQLQRNMFSPMDAQQQSRRQVDEAALDDAAHEAVELERVRMEVSRADKLFNSPFVENDGGVDHAYSIPLPFPLGSRVQSGLSPHPQTPASVSYIYEHTPASAVDDDDEIARGVVERLTFPSGLEASSLAGATTGTSARRLQGRLPSQESNNSEVGLDDDDLHQFMEAALRDALQSATRP